MTPDHPMPAPAGYLFPHRDPEHRLPMSVDELVGTLRRHRYLILGCTALVSLLALGLHAMQVPVHTSTASVLIQTEQLGTPSFLSGVAAYRESQAAEPASRRIETEMALILNRPNAARIVDKLAITPAQLPVSPLARVQGWITQAFRSEKDVAETETTTGSQSRIVDAFLASINVEAARSKTAETTSNVLELQLESTDPQLAPKALSAVLDAYLAIGTQQNLRLASTTSELLSSQVKRAQKDLDGVENAIAAFIVRAASQPDLAVGATAADSATAAGASSRREGGRGIHEAATTQLTLQLLELQGQLDELRQTYTDETENVRKLKQRIADTRARLAGQMRLGAANNAELGRLERQRLLAQDRYMELRRKLDQVDLYMRLAPTATDGRLIIAPPSKPDESQAARKKLVALAGPPAGLLLGLLIAFLSELSRPRLRTRRDVERALDIPMLGALPTMRGLEDSMPRLEERGEQR